MSDSILTKSACQNASVRRADYLRPPYEVSEVDSAYWVAVYLPGVSKDWVSITFEGKTLLLEASRKSVAGENWRAQHREIPTGDYRLRLDLNFPVDVDAVTARTEDGVLTIVLPITEEARARKIAVQ
jgi:HSP20 family protein